MLLSVALIAAVSFREPVVVPPVRELEYRDDVETDETIGRFCPADAAIPVSLDKARRCRLILLEPACRDFAAGVSGQSL